MKNIIAERVKDRVVPISEKVILMIDLYITHFRPEKYLFEGQYRGEQV
jgi:hypothetical protein